MKNEMVLTDLNALDDLLSEQSYLLYGAGNTGRTVVKYARRFGFPVSKIVVSDGREHPSGLLGIPVLSVSEASGLLPSTAVIVCTVEESHREIAETLSHHKTREVYFISGVLLRKLQRATGELEADLTDMDYRLNRLDRQLRFIPEPCLRVLVVNILDHCNLRCKGCDHFACIADPHFVPYETVRNDIERLGTILHGDHIVRIGVMGGEPLLHPDLLKIMITVRESFPHVPLRIVTNGILLMNQDERFWDIFREYNLQIWVTKYPLKLDYQGMVSRAKEAGVKINFWRCSDSDGNLMFKKVLDLRGENDPVESFLNCHISNYGNTVMEGKFYSCPFSCQAHRVFNRKFQTDLRMTERDYLEIEHISDMQELFDFAARPKFFCRYCHPPKGYFKWEPTKREITEWVEEECLEEIGYSGPRIALR